MILKSSTPLACLLLEVTTGMGMGRAAKCCPLSESQPRRGERPLAFVNEKVLQCWQAPVSLWFYICWVGCVGEC